jgi:hypothetical protein
LIPVHNQYGRGLSLNTQKHFESDENFKMKEHTFRVIYAGSPD